MNYQVERHMEKMEDQLAQELADGLITQAEYNAEIREMQREYLDMAREAAEAEYQSWF